MMQKSEFASIVEKSVVKRLCFTFYSAFLYYNIVREFCKNFLEVVLNNTVPVLQMIAQSDIVTMIILGILAFMSLGSWGIIIVKFFKHKSNLHSNAKFFKDFCKLKHFSELQRLCSVSKDSALRLLSVEVLNEVSKFKGKVNYESIQHRASLLEDAIQRSIEGLRMREDRYLTFLATSSNLAPFFGLLGTVWGIMIAFFQIGHHGSADLTVVAPGIAMALITTVAGLVVAIPASAGYNYFISNNGRNETSYYNFGSQVLSLFKRGDLLAVEGIGEEDA